MTNFISSNLARIRANIRAAEEKYQRKPNSVKLIAVSKKQPIDKMLDAIAAGHRTFAENYLQEVLEKKECLKDKKIEWHFIGHIQRNKTKHIAEHFNWVQSVDSFLIAERLSHQRPSHLPTINALAEVNISNEESKYGVKPEEIFDLAMRIRELPNLKLRGIMCIPAKDDDTAFKRMHQLFLDLQAKGFDVDTLSMGMTADYEDAIAHGATMVRIGTGIFGERP